MKSVEWYGLAARTGVAAAIVLVCLTTLIPIAHAQSPPIRSEVDKTELKTGEVLTLTVTVTAEGNISAGPTLPVVLTANIVGRDLDSQTVKVDNQTTTELMYEYQLSPTVDGPLTIGAIKVTIDGTTYETDPITVEVHPGGSTRATQQSPTLPPAEVSTELTGQPYFVEAEVDNRSPYVGEQVHYIFRFYYSVPSGSPYYEKPDLTGFWVLEDSKPSLSSRMVSGRRYAIEEINKVLFPTIAGPRTIGSAVITIPGGRTEPARRLSTTPVEIDVRPLPPGAPTDFSGAVGRFSISARTNGASGAVNEPLTLTVNLTGEGNFDLLPDPGWPDTPGWRTFDAAPKTISRIDDGVLIGRRTYERTLVPREAGDFTIPPVRFTYFDPSKDTLRDHIYRSHTGDGRQGYCRAAPAGRGRGLRRETGHRHPPHQARARIARGRLGPAAREGALLGNGSPSGGRAGGRHRLAQDEGRRQPYQAPATGPIAGRGVC